MNQSSEAQEFRIFENLKKKISPNGKLSYPGTLLQRAYQLYGKQTALITADREVAYEELFFRSILLSKTLTSKGVSPHDRVLLFSENSLEFYIAYFAIWQIGAVVVPINIFLHERELIHIINDAQPKAIVASPSLISKIETLPSDRCAGVPLIITHQDFDWTSSVPISSKNSILTNFTVTELEEDELSVLLYTSGTTGVPKGVMLSSKNVMTNVLQCYARFMTCGMSEQDRFFCVLPLFHVFAQNTCLWLPVMTGSSVIIVSKIDRKLIMDGLKKKPTLFFGFPALYGLLCLMKTAPLDSIKLFVSGADMLPDKIRAGFAIIYGRRIASGYGLTEAAPVVAVNHENEEESTNVVGRPVAGLMYQIRDDQGFAVPQGSAGNLWIKGDNIMMGYYNDPEATKRVLINGWLNTGDLASINKKEKLAICGRSKDIIIHKGFNIYPAEIENVLLMHPAVFKAAVIGKEETINGQIPIAFVAAKYDDPELETKLRELCSHNLAAYKIPRKFVCLNDLPMNATGKIDKKQLLQSADMQ